MRRRLAVRFAVVGFVLSWMVALDNGALRLDELPLVAAAVAAAAGLGALVGTGRATRARVFLRLLVWTPLMGGHAAIAIAMLSGESWPFAGLLGACAALFLMPVLTPVALVEGFEPLFKNSNTCSNLPR